MSIALGAQAAAFVVSSFLGPSATVLKAFVEADGSGDLYCSAISVLRNLDICNSGTSAARFFFVFFYFSLSLPVS